MECHEKKVETKEPVPIDLYAELHSTYLTFCAFKLRPSNAIGDFAHACGQAGLYFALFEFIILFFICAEEAVIVRILCHL